MKQESKIYKTHQKNLLTKKKWYLQEKRKEISAIIFIGLFGLIGFLAPFSHIYYNNSEVSGMFGFKKMSSFLFAIGFPILSVCSGILLGIASRELKGNLSKCFSICSILFFFVGIFFLTWALAPSVKDFDPYYYYISMIGISIVFTFILKLFSTHIFTLSKNIEHLKNTIRGFFTFMYKDAEEKQLIHPEKSLDFRKIRLELTNKAIENEQEG